MAADKRATFAAATLAIAPVIAITRGLPSLADFSLAGTIIATVAALYSHTATR